MLICPLCAKTFYKQHIFESHIFSHTKEKPHTCPTCSTTFPRLGSLNAHIKNVHSGIKIKNLQCPECSYKCHGGGALTNHLRKHSPELPFSCSVPSCSFKTKYKAGLASHIRGVHSRSTLYRCKSDRCSFKTSWKDSLCRHLKTHSNERPFACTAPGCNYTCKTKEYLQVHTKGVHSDEKPWKCSTCDFRTNHKSYLKKHEAAHNGMKRFRCQALNCRYACNANKDLVFHFDRKHRKKEIFCTEPRCKYRCGSTALLKKHLRRGHKLPILKCPVGSCAYSTRLNSNLHAHVSRHRGDRNCVSPLVSRKPFSAYVGPNTPVETRSCPFPNCGYQTDFPHRYDRHILTHNKGGQRKHACQFCSSKFDFSTQLQIHIQRHVGEKPHKCSYCDYTTIDGRDLRHHAQRVHHIFVIPRGNEHQCEWECLTCNLTFSSYSEFMLHSMTHLQPVVGLERLRVHVL